MDYENWKILQSEYSKHQNEYENVSNWCSENNQYFIDGSDGIYYKVAKIPEPSEKDLLLEEKNNLLKKLEETDYITNKLAEVVDNMEVYREMKEHYSDKLSQRQFWRQRIREIEDELKDLENES